jgi:hypothetical protein
VLRNDAVNSVGQKVLGVAETLKAVTAKVGEEEKSQEDVGGSSVQEPGPDVGNENTGQNEQWEVVHRPGIVFELTALSSPPAATEEETPPRINPIRLTLDGPESVVKGIKYQLDDAELTDVKVEPLTGTGQEGLWTVEVPRMSRDLATLRIS